MPVHIIIGNKDAAKFIYIDCASSGGTAIPLLAPHKDSLATDLNAFIEETSASFEARTAPRSYPTGHNVVELAA
jgi:hypothetical protein